jgi:hypothetical protein
MRRLFLLACLLTIAGFGITRAQGTGTISGTIRNASTQEAIPGATVRLEGTTLGAIANAKGEYRIKNIPPKSYTVKATSVGFTPKQLFNVVVTSGNVVNLVIELDPATSQGEAVTVEGRTFGKRSETPLSVQSLTTEEIRSNPGGNFDISRVLQALPGVGGATGGASFRNDITVRGGGPSENVYYLDGIEIPQINHFATQGSAGGPAGILNVAFIEDVTLSSSSFASGYDNALSSVIAVTQKEGNKEKLQGNIRVSATEVALTFDGPVSDNTTFIASARRSYLDLLFAAIDLPIRPNFWDFQFKTTTQFDNRTTLTVLGVGALDLFEFGVPRNSTPDKEFVLRSAPAVEQWNYTIGASLKKSFDNGQLFAVLSRNMFDNQLLRNVKDNLGNVTGVGFRVNSQEIENKARVEYRTLSSNSSVRVGVQGQYSKYNNATFNQLSPDRVLDFASDMDFFRYGAYADVATSLLSNRLQISGGVRADGNTFMTTGNEFWRTFSPRVSASYALDSAWNLNASAGRYFKLPQYTILGFRDANNELVNRDTRYIGTTHYVAGLEWVPEPSIRMTLEGFYKTYSDYPVSLLDSVSLANRGTDFIVLGNEPVASVGRGRAYGAELFFQKKLTERFFTTVSYTLLFSEFTGLFSNDFIPSAWDFRHLISGIVGYKLDDGWEFGAKFRYAGGSPFTPIDTAASRRLYLLTGQVQLDNARLNQERLRAFRQVDIRIDKKWSFNAWSLDLFLDVQNVFGFVLDAPQQYTFQRTPDNTDWVSTDGQPVRPDGSNAIPLFLDNTSTLVTPTIGIIIEF